MRLLLTLFFVLVSPLAFANMGRPLESLPIQDGGRVKPFATFANETLQVVYGRAKYEGKSATEVIFTWMLVPDHWMQAPVIEIRHAGLKEALQLPVESEVKHYSPQSLMSNPRVGLVLQELNSLRNRGEKPNPYYQAVQRLENQLGLFQAIRTGQAIRLVPDPNSDTWISIANLQDEKLRTAFTGVTQNFVSLVAKVSEGGKADATLLEAAVENFKSMAAAHAPDKYGNPKKLKWELFLNRVHPFMWAWIAYLLSVIFLVVGQVGKVSWAPKASWFFLLTGFFLHTLGMGVRSYVVGRPPVSNMYETVVWVPWGTLLFGMILERFQKSKLLLGASAIVAVFCLILTDLSPTVLDKSLHPLEPVLRSNFWLLTHVLIITISYAAFFLAFAVADVLLFYYLKDEKKYAKEIKSGTNSIYRAIQIGVVLLAAGTILGGVWADYSWGRFWGWDPKETWAFIALLGYLALLHGRLFGWVKDFEMSVGAVVSFSLVIMAWYGVNFVLGAGLHTYGFGAGGVEYVTGFVVAHLLYVAYVSTVRYGRLKK